jgi:hypothetical protein
LTEPLKKKKKKKKKKEQKKRMGWGASAPIHPFCFCCRGPGGFAAPLAVGEEQLPPID